MMNLLVVTTLYPNPMQKRHGIFVETRLRHLIQSDDVNAVVVAPVPWFPFKNSAQYIDSRDIPKMESRNGIKIYHPRYLVIPKIGMLLTPFFLALSLWLQIKSIIRSGYHFDLVDGHYFYPDGVAIALLARTLKVPFTLTARGTDINLIPKYRLPRQLILWAAKKAAASITVCAALKDEMVNIGADADKISVLRNGVDLELFSPQDREECRKKYSLSGKTLLSVGHLTERKGHHLVIEALRELPEFTLLIAGDGEQQKYLESLVEQWSLQDRVRFLGAVSQQQLAMIYNAADALVLASSREGWANVLLESMACGTPVVATSIWGTPEVVTSDHAGRLVPERTSSAIAATVRALFDNYPDHKQTRQYAEAFSWDETSSGLLKLISGCVRQSNLASGKEQTL